jgi:hypothetical protein
MPPGELWDRRFYSRSLHGSVFASVPAVLLKGEVLHLGLLRERRAPKRGIQDDILGTDKLAAFLQFMLFSLFQSN